jgi:hypothetical protein
MRALLTFVRVSCCWSMQTWLAHHPHYISGYYLDQWMVIICLRAHAA